MNAKINAQVCLVHWTEHIVKRTVKFFRRVLEIVVVVVNLIYLQSSHISFISMSAMHRMQSYYLGVLYAI